MLLVNDDKAQFGELYFLLDQSMRSDYKLRTALGDVAANFAFAVVFQRTSQEDDAVSRRLEDAARGKIMLLRENLGRGHSAI